MPTAWLLLTIICLGHTNTTCWPEVASFASKEACEKAVKAGPRRAVCFPVPNVNPSSE